MKDAGRRALGAGGGGGPAPSDQGPASNLPLAVTAITAAAQLGGTERVLRDFANRAFEFDVALRVLTPTDGPLVGILNEIGVPCEVVPAPSSILQASQRGVNIWRLPFSVMGLRAWGIELGKHPFVRDADVIYTQGFKAHLAAAVSGKRPVVWHLHEFPPSVTGWFWKALMRSRADAVITNSGAVGETWALGAGRPTPTATSAQRPAPQQYVVPNGVDLDRFTVRPPTKWIHRRLGVPEHHRLVGMPAVFARWKGQLEVMEAFRMIADEFPEVHLVLVGGSIYDTVAERKYGRDLDRALVTGRWALEGAGGQRPAPSARRPRIHILPFQPKIELVYPEFDLVIHYSTRPEPFGRVIVEAMACGVPVIASDEGGPAEILGGGIGHGASGVGGWLVEPRAPAKLAETLRDALRLPAERLDAIGAAGRRRAEDQYSARRFAREVSDVLKALRRET
jgi:glycosyltransferase involved in cell wall biosynthesis